MASEGPNGQVDAIMSRLLDFLAAALRGYLGVSLSKRMIWGFLLGIPVGLLLGPEAAVLTPLGDLFIRLLRMLVIPIVVTTIVAGVAGITPRQVGRIGVKIVALYAGLSLGATALGVAIAVLLRPGVGIPLPGADEVTEVAPTSATELLLGFVPENLPAALVRGEILPLIFFSVLAALAIAVLRQGEHAEGAESLRRLVEAAARVVYEILQWILEYGPVGAFALVAVTFGGVEPGALADFAKVLASVYVGQAAVCALALALLAAFGIGPLRFVRDVTDALVTAYVTRSSAATLPVELEVAEEKLGIEPSVFGFTLPLGNSTSMMGTAVHLGVVSVFAAHLGGVEPGPPGYVTITLLAFLGSVNTPPISGGALIVMGFVFQEAGLPLEAIALIMGIPLLGNFNTPINSFGRMVATAVVARTERPRRARVPTARARAGKTWTGRSGASSP